MEHETDKIHVISLADDWEVESQRGVPLAHEEEKCDAVETAKKLAQQRGVETVILHHEDEVIEKLSAAPAEETTAPAETAEMLAATSCEVILLGSIASGKYGDCLLPIFA
jgi:hypothetical protein